MEGLEFWKKQNLMFFLDFKQSGKILKARTGVVLLRYP